MDAYNWRLYRMKVLHNETENSLQLKDEDGRGRMRWKASSNKYRGFPFSAVFVFLPLSFALSPPKMDRAADFPPPLSPSSSFISRSLIRGAFVMNRCKLFPPKIFLDSRKDNTSLCPKESLITQPHYFRLQQHFKGVNERAESSSPARNHGEKWCVFLASREERRSINKERARRMRS